ncbi:MAG: putative PEP-binding protein, partial [Rubricoccaceae bacterium]|nr:putative PEP-binding protein [Rubricoccaceae bacterium]
MPESLFRKDVRHPQEGLDLSREVIFEGIGVAPGIAIGPAYRYAGGAYQADPEKIARESVQTELDRFEAAVFRSERELQKIVTVAQEKLGDDSGQIFDAQLLMLRDPAFYDAVASLISDKLLGAGYAVQTVLKQHRSRLEGAGSLAVRERSADIRDVQNRVLRNLQQGRAVSRIDAERIVVAENLTAADVLLFSRRGVLGCVLDFGGPTSHVSIMARALGVPTVVSLHELATRVHPGDTLILDGLAGKVILHPEEETLARYKHRQARYRAITDRKEELAAQDATTSDGHRIRVQANIEFREELPLLHEYGAEGIGLFRTEMLFLAQGRALDEDQQVETYRETVKATSPHGVTFRLIDLGGDKLLPVSQREANPFLGWRGVRILLDKPELLRTQLRAILRS